MRSDFVATVTLPESNQVPCFMELQGEGGTVQFIGRLAVPRLFAFNGNYAEIRMVTPMADQLPAEQRPPVPPPVRPLSPAACCSGRVGWRMCCVPVHLLCTDSAPRRTRRSASGSSRRLRA